MRNVIFCLALLALAACAPKAHGPVVPASNTVALADFIHPRYDWELMAGVLGEDMNPVKPEVLSSLNGIIENALAARGRTFIPSSAVHGCAELAVADKERQRIETVEYWRSIGKCLKVDLLLIPYLMQWQDREGSEWGVNTPAGVALDLYLLDVASGQVQRFHYDEVQRGLAENLLEGKRFLKRKGKWVTPTDIAAEAITEGLKELGL